MRKKKREFSLSNGIREIIKHIDDSLVVSTELSLGIRFLKINELVEEEQNAPTHIFLDLIEEQYGKIYRAIIYISKMINIMESEEPVYFFISMNRCELMFSENFAQRRDDTIIDFDIFKKELNIISEYINDDALNTFANNLELTIDARQTWTLDNQLDDEFDKNFDELEKSLKEFNVANIQRIREICEFDNINEFEFIEDYPGGPIFQDGEDFVHLFQTSQIAQKITDKFKEILNLPKPGEEEFTCENCVHYYTEADDIKCRQLNIIISDDFWCKYFKY